MQKKKREPASWGTMLKMALVVGVIVALVLAFQWVAANIWAAIPIALAIGAVGGAAAAKPEFRTKLTNSARKVAVWLGIKKDDDDKRSRIRT